MFFSGFFGNLFREFQRSFGNGLFLHGVGEMLVHGCRLQEFRRVVCRRCILIRSGSLIAFVSGGAEKPTAVKFDEEVVKKIKPIVLTARS